MSNPMNDPLAALDQMIAALGDMARAMASYHRELTEAGFDRAEALTIVVAWQHDFISSSSPSADG